MHDINDLLSTTAAPQPLYDPEQWKHADFLEVLALPPRQRSAPAKGTPEYKDLRRYSERIGRTHMKLVEADAEDAIRMARRLSDTLYNPFSKKQVIRVRCQEADRFDPGTQLVSVLPRISNALYSRPRPTAEVDLPELEQIRDELLAFQERHDIAGDLRFAAIRYLAGVLTLLIRALAKSGE